MQPSHSEQAARRGDWIQTFTGEAFYPLDPRYSEIHITDIAHALGMQCRFTGHTKVFYSVAEHCVHVSRLVGPGTELCLAALLHDASEAYLIDLARPLKRLPQLSGYRDAEEVLQTAIFERFSRAVPLDQYKHDVDRADKRMLAAEAQFLMGNLRPGWEKWLRLLTGDEPVPVGWPPWEAERQFLARFHELTQEQR